MRKIASLVAVITIFALAAPLFADENNNEVKLTKAEFVEWTNSITENAADELKQAEDAVNALATPIVAPRLNVGVDPERTTMVAEIGDKNPVGFMVGDTILSIDGHPISSIQDIRTFLVARDEKMRGSVAVIEVRRGEKTEKLKATRVLLRTAAPKSREEIQKKIQEERGLVDTFKKGAAEIIAKTKDNEMVSNGDLRVAALIKKGEEIRDGIFSVAEMMREAYEKAAREAATEK